MIFQSHRAALWALTLCAASAPLVFAAPAKTPGKGATKTLPSKTPAAGALVKGKGLMDFEATLASRGANLLRTSYKTDHGKYRTFPQSTATVDFSNGMTVVVAPLTQAMIPDPDSAPLTVQQGMTMAFASKGGFRVGQTISIKIPQADSNGKSPAATALFDYTQIEVKPDPKQRKSSSQPTRHVMRSSVWTAMRGTLTITSVSPKSVKFSIANVVFENPRPTENNYAKGSFVMNGRGEARLTEVDDGFH